MPSLWFDGDLQRVYEVPDDSSFTVDASGYRVYTPNNLATAPTTLSFTVIEVWSAWVDYHDANKWALLCFDRSAGEFRETDADGNDIFGLTELRFLNDWHYVPADYRHLSILDGNFLPNLSTGNHFDTDRITSIPPPEVKVLFADRGQLSIIDGGGSGGGGGDHDHTVVVGDVPVAMAATLIGGSEVAADGAAIVQLAATGRGSALVRVGNASAAGTTTLWADFGEGITGASAA